jgi:hypothetical protein
LELGHFESSLKNGAKYLWGLSNVLVRKDMSKNLELVTSVHKLEMFWHILRIFCKLTDIFCCSALPSVIVQWFQDTCAMVSEVTLPSCEFVEGTKLIQHSCANVMRRWHECLVTIAKFASIKLTKSQLNCCKLCAIIKRHLHEHCMGVAENSKCTSHDFSLTKLL